MNYDAESICHDHFDGSAHCVECEGGCRLTGPALTYTALVRAMFEAEALHGQRIAYMTECQMERSGVDVERFRERAAKWAVLFRSPRMVVKNAKDGRETLA